MHPSGCVAGKARASCPCWAPSISRASCPNVRLVLEMLGGKEREFYIMRALGIAGCLTITSPGQERIDTSVTCETVNQRVWRKRRNWFPLLVQVSCLIFQ